MGWGWISGRHQVAQCSGTLPVPDCNCQKKVKVKIKRSEKDTHCVDERRYHGVQLSDTASWLRPPKMASAAFWSSASAHKLRISSADVSIMWWCNDDFEMSASLASYFKRYRSAFDPRITRTRMAKSWDALIYERTRNVRRNASPTRREWDRSRVRTLPPMYPICPVNKMLVLKKYGQHGWRKYFIRTLCASSLWQNNAVDFSR